MALLFEFAAGSGLGAVAGEAMKIGMDATERVFNYPEELQNLKTTLNHISECVEKIKALNNKLGIGHEFMEALQNILEAADETVSKCREDDNLLKRLSQTGEITDLDNVLQNFLSKIMPLYQFKETKEIRHDIQEMRKIIQTHEKMEANRVLIGDLMDSMVDFWWDITLKPRLPSLPIWKLRYKISRIIARAIYSYHDDGSEKIHGNINSSNVVFNRDLDGCIITNDNGSYPLIYNNRGSGVKFINVPGMKPNSIGYHAPEVIQTGRATQKSDVYSFGVIQLEILTGENPSLCDLPKKVRSMILNGNECEVFDEKLLQGPTRDEDMLEMKKMLEIAMQCVAEDPNERPNMGDVVRMIENIRTIT